MAYRRDKRYPFGILSYINMITVRWFHPLLSAVVFGLFGLMFFKMSFKHTKRIHGYPQATRPFWNFFDIKAYCIMAFMMTGGIWLRSSGLVPNTFIAVFYSGLGFALSLAGVMFFIRKSCAILYERSFYALNFQITRTVWRRLSGRTLTSFLKLRIN